MNIKELERLEDNNSAAKTIYLSTPLDAADINAVYAKYKDAYLALSYARCFNLNNNN